MRLHVITGKGGTGKTTVAAALAIALASDGHRVLLAEVEGRQGIAQLFDVPPLPYVERKVAVAPGGGDVYGLAVDAEEALLEYLEMFYNLKRAGRALKRFGAIDFATAIAPGMRDVLLTGKIVEATKRREKNIRPTYDAVVLDAPPTGRIVRFLNVNHEVAGLARMGPIRNHADSVMNVLRSAQTAVHIVTILEEMPIQETADGVTQLHAAGLPVGAIVINMVRPPLLPSDVLAKAVLGHMDVDEIAQGLKEAGIDPTPKVLDALVAEVTDHAHRVALEDRERIELAQLGRATYELPMLTDAVDLGGLYRMAELLIEQGMVPLAAGRTDGPQSK